MFYILLFKKNVTKKELIVKKIANQFEFKNKKQPEQKVDFIIDYMIFAKEAINSRLLELYYLIY